MEGFHPDEMPQREAGASNESDRRVVDLVPASTVRLEQTRWAWRDRIPLGGVTLLAGQEGSGKTTILTDVLARATRGTLDGDLYGEPVGVVYATAEDSWARTLAPRFAASGADMDRVYFVEVDGLAGGLSVPGDLIALAEKMTATGSRILVLDPLGAHLADGLDTHKDAAVRRALAPLASIMDRADSAVVGIVHWSKAPTTVALDRVNGSRGFTAAARAMLAVAEDPGDETARVLVLAKSNLGRLDLPALRYRIEGREVINEDGKAIATSGVQWLGEAPGVGVGDIFASGADPDERSDRDAVAEVIRDVLTAGEQQRDVVIKAVRAAGLDVSAKTIQRACRSLGVERKRIGFGATFVLALPNLGIVDNASEACPPVHNVQIGSDQDSSASATRRDAHSGQPDRATNTVPNMGGTQLSPVAAVAEGCPPPDETLFYDDVEDAP